MNQSIIFPDEQRWDEALEAIVFPVQVSGMLVECIAKSQVLSKLSGEKIESAQQAIECFKQVRFDVEELAEQAIEEEEYDSSGRIQI
ncbi:DUF1488 domain-containing protein [Vibrio marisflavi]|uniref:Transcriptional regulator n=1 Tax=Vibrio marisflavi CECT 7928 TaxID=634439 RepID=A0ABN8EAB8_9VIBR|nr:DUF1488 domain-containing protein [Vibrio marisflavi]CAH0541894.1 hypothetical protein VMF7928_03924 [Vibrio marisflavi CECT 7928]